MFPDLHFPSAFFAGVYFPKLGVTFPVPDAAPPGHGGELQASGSGSAAGIIGSGTATVPAGSGREDG